MIDFDGDSGSDALCILANYSEQFSVGDDERAVVVADICGHSAGGLAAAKILLAEGGIIASGRTRLPFAAVPDETRSAHLDLARRQDPLILRWAA